MVAALANRSTGPADAVRTCRCVSTAADTHACKVRTWGAEVSWTGLVVRSHCPFQKSR